MIIIRNRQELNSFFERPDIIKYLDEQKIEGTTNGYKTLRATKLASFLKPTIYLNEIWVRGKVMVKFE
jgi:hypothetical protein